MINIIVRKVNYYIATILAITGLSIKKQSNTLIVFFNCSLQMVEDASWGIGVVVAEAGLAEVLLEV